MDQFVVHETSDQLRRLLQKFTGTRSFARVMMLSIIKDRPSSSIRGISREIGVPESTLRRWISVYNEGGLDALVSVKGGRSRVALHGTPASTYSYSSDTDAPESVLQLLPSLINRLPVTPDSQQWTRSFGDLLIEVFPDIDYAIANVRVTVDLINPDTNRHGITYRQDFSRSAQRFMATMHRGGKDEGPEWMRLVAEGKRHGFLAEQYHDPVGFDYFIAKEAYLGSLVLFSKKSNMPTAESTLRLFERLHPFLTGVFFHHVAVHQLQHPADLLYRDLSTMIASDAGLTQRELEVVQLLFLGHSYEEASELLSVSKSTLLSHVRKIYRKTNVTKLSELFARYLTPRLYFKGRGDSEDL